MRFARAGMAVIEIAPQRLCLFCWEAHHRVLTLDTGSGSDRATPAISGACLISCANSWRLRPGDLVNGKTPLAIFFRRDGDRIGEAGG